MNRRILFAISFLILVLIPAGLTGQEVIHHDQVSFNGDLVSERVPVDQIILKFMPGAEQQWLADREATLASFSQAAGVELAFYRPMSGNAYVLKMAEGHSPAEAAAIAARLGQLAEVEYAEPDLVKQLADRPRTTLLLTPNDTFFGDQWHYQYTAGSSEGLNLVPAWDITTGSESTVAAVIDTGILNHTDLAGRTVPGYDFISNTFVANDGDGRDNNPADPGDWITVNECGFPHGAQSSSWHGTHVAGTIGANTNNNLGVAGVNWATRILPVRVLGKCGGFTSDIIDAVRWAAGLSVPGVPNNANPADVLNLSLGGSGSCSAAEQSAYDDAVAAGATVVVAAGNNNGDAANFTPANCNNVITVAANDRTGDKASYSNYGSVVEITAPGGETGQAFSNGVLSILDSGATTPANDNVYAWYQGTSMATPHIVGLVSLMLAVNDQLTPAQLLTYLQDNARAFPAGSSCTTAICGTGIADAFAALQAIQAPVTDGIIAGTVLIQGRINHSAADVCVLEGAVEVACTQSDASGDYELMVPEGVYDLAVEMPRYLDGLKNGVTVTSQATTALTNVSLRGGDSNDDDIVNILDLAFMGARYLLSCGDPGFEASADINNDCLINIQDIALSGSNYLATSPVEWP